MPDIWAHILCGNRILDGIKNKNLKNMINYKMKVFQFGTQGPDMFHYYRFIPGIKPRELKKMGEILHTQKTGDFILNGLEYIKNIDDEESFKNLFSYISGYISHFSLDRTAHPYIIYSSRYYASTRKGKHLEGIYHKRIEAIIDLMVLHKYVGESAVKLSGYYEIDIGNKLPGAIIDLFMKLLKDTYRFNIDASFINRAYNDMKLGLKLVHDPRGRKQKLLSFTEKIITNGLKYSFILQPDITSLEDDYLNNTHIIWTHPEDKNHLYDWSFYELFEISVEEGQNMLLAAWEFINSKMSKKEIRNFFPNQSYLTGKFN